MSGFKDMVARDNFGVFLNCDEFAEKRTVKYDGATYEDIPIVLSGLKEKDRRQLMSDHAQGLYIVSSVLHCALSDLGGVQPERGQRIRINDQEAVSYTHLDVYKRQDLKDEIEDAEKKVDELTAELNGRKPRKAFGIVPRDW